MIYPAVFSFHLDCNLKNCCVSVPTLPQLRNCSCVWSGGTNLQSSQLRLEKGAETDGLKAKFVCGPTQIDQSV